MKYAVMLFRMMLIAGIALSFSACGKISDPKPIENSGYPHTYPRI